MKEMSILKEAFVIVALTNQGQQIAQKECESYPNASEIEGYANGYQQADYCKVEKRYMYKTA